jgi:hypothetical protein
MRQTVLALALFVSLGFATVASAQPPFSSTAPASTPTPMNNTCTYPFTTGAGATSFSWCLSPNGNIVQFVAPAGQGQVPGIAEGYAVCSASGIHGEDEADYVPIPFQPAVVVSGCTGGALPCVISRDTTDNVFRVTQKFTQNKTEDEIDIDMTVLNLSSVVQNASQITRLTMPANDNVYGSEIVDKSTRSAWGRLSPNGNSLVLRTDTFATAATTDIVGCYSNGCAVSCGPSSLPAGPGVYAMQDTYNLGDLKPLKSKTVRFQLRRQ